MPEYQQVNRHIECDARTYASLVPNQMRYQTALHPDVQQRLEILTGFPSRRRSPPALSRNGIAPNGMDGNRDFPEKLPWRSRAAMVSSIRMLAALICAAFGFLCLPGQAPGQESGASLPPIVGRARVIDGDTIEIGGRMIRLQGIDAPESAQLCEDSEGRNWRCGEAATAALDALVYGKGEVLSSALPLTVACQQDPRDAEDRYGRALAMCRAGDIDINLVMVLGGHVVAYKRYLDWRDGSPRPHKADFLLAEDLARRSRRGIWQGRFTLPEEWRAARRGK
jgi:endonuclease YncB( thermonuclease family)